MCSSCDCKCKTEDTKFPADWAIQRAISLMVVEKRVLHSSTPRVAEVKSGHWPSLMSFARYIEKNEKPPVSPELKAARQYAADQTSFQYAKTCILSGVLDHRNIQILSFLAGVEWARSNNG